MDDCLRKIANIANDFAALSRDTFMSDLDTICNMEGSPIEILFGAALIFALKEQIPEFSFEFMEDASDLIDGKEYYSNFVLSQKKIGAYTVDFYLFAKTACSGPLRIVIECDGHDFHERTKQQAAHDRRKDRWLQSQGFIVMRYTGSEIWADAVGCARQVAKLASDRIFSLVAAQ
jgi:very-short-patch-repair endonuclease